MKRIIHTIITLAVSLASAHAQISDEIKPNVSDVSVSKSAGYDVIKLSGANHVTNQVGMPELPVISKTFVIPTDAQITNIEIKENRKTELQGTFRPYPVQPPVTTGGTNQNFIEPFDTIYNGASTYPAKRAEIVADYINMGYHLVTIWTYPIEFDPISKKIFISGFNFTINYETKAQTRTKPLAQSTYRASMIKKMIKSMVDNPDDVEKNSNAIAHKTMARKTATNGIITLPSIRDDMEYQIPDYIIITNDTLRPFFNSLAEWKIEKGISTITKDIAEIEEEYIGSDLPEKIHAYLQDCYHKWGEGLFVLLGGDTEIIPSRMYIRNKQKYPSDAYYADLECDWNSNKNHIYAESSTDGVKLDRFCFIGRAPISNKEEAKTFVEKVLNYERLDTAQINPNYVLNHLAALAYITKEDTLENGEQDLIDNELSNFRQLNKWCLFDHYNCNCGNHSPSTTKYNNKGEELTRINFLNALNNGGNSGLGHFHIVYHMDHCAPRVMGASNKDKNENVSIDDVDALSNGKYQQIIISGGCSPAEFSKDCIAEHFIKNPNGGAVAFIGNANNGYAGDEVQYKCFLNSLYNERITSLGILTEKMCKVGVITELQFSNIPSSMRLHLLGDPEMPVWSDAPKKLDAEVTRQYTPDKKHNKVTIQIKNLPAGEEAMVCISKADDYYNRIIISDTEEHEFLLEGNKSSGTMKVTITARNFIPYQKNFQLDGAFYNGYLKIASLNGFPKHVAIGDSASFYISIKNTRGSIANAKATLTSLSPYVKVEGESRMTYGDIGPNGTKKGEKRFKISVSKDAPERMRNEWNAACLMLTINGNYTPYEQTYTFVDTFRIDMVSPKLRIASIKVTSTSNGDKKLEAGETATIALNYSRLGKASTQPASWIIEPTIGNIDEINFTSENNCTIKIGKLYQTGAPLWTKMILLDGSIAQDSVIVDIAHPGPNVNLAKIHSSSTENAISFYWDKMSSETKYNIYRSASINGKYQKLNKVPLTTRYYEDNDVSKRTPYYYKLSTLSENNLEGELSAAFTGITTYKLMMQKTLSTGNSCFINEAYATDFDYDGQKEIIQVARTSVNQNENYSTLYIVKPDGSEPYDIDRNVTTFSGYAKYPWIVEAVPVVADLFGNGEPCIVTFARSTDEYGKTYAVCHSSQDKNGDDLPDKLWQTEIEGCFYRGAIATDIDIPDKKGEKEIIALEENRKGITILNADGSIRNKFGANKIAMNYSSLAVSDLDGDGYKEIICGAENGIYIWRHNGTPFHGEPFFSRPGSDLRSSPVVCDFDNDGRKEILIAERNDADPDYIFAIRTDGTCLPGFDGSDASVSIQYPSAPHEGLDHAISVGDINGDGLLEVVSLGVDCVKAWNNQGSQVLNRNIQGLFNMEEWANHLQTPIIADIDGYGEMDIVFNDKRTIYAIHADGTDVQSFPMPNTAEMNQSVCISDIDADGKNELIASDLEGYINVWKTDGHGIEWGNARFDPGHTGEYIRGNREPKIIMADRNGFGTVSNSDIIVRKGTLNISNKSCTLNRENKIIVMAGGTLKVDNGSIKNASILIKAGGQLIVDNGGEITISQYGNFTAEAGALVNIINGEIKKQINSR